MKTNYYWVTQNRYLLLLKKDILVYKPLCSEEVFDLNYSIHQTNWYKEAATIFFDDIRKIEFYKGYIAIQTTDNECVKIQIDETDVINSIKDALVVLGPAYNNQYKCVHKASGGNKYIYAAMTFIFLSAFYSFGLMGLSTGLMMLLYNTVEMFLNSNTVPTYIETFEYGIQI